MNRKLPNQKFKAFLSLIFLFFSKYSYHVYASDSTYVNNGTKLVVYTSIPGINNSPNIATNIQSNYYRFRVASDATEGKFVDCFTNITRSLHASALPYYDNGMKQGYFDGVANWSHSYSNIEMSIDKPVTVQIIRINNWRPKGRVFEYAKGRPNKNIQILSIKSDTITFQITNTGQFTVDINGQMDETDTYIEQTNPIHTISLFANPIKNDKPNPSLESIYYVEPGSVAPNVDIVSQYKTIYFKPGVHDVGLAYRIFANKNYYIPGDAIVYGTFFNKNNSGANIKLHGFGTLSGDRIAHPKYLTSMKQEPDKDTGHQYRLIFSDQSSNFLVKDLSLMNCPMHTIAMQKGGDNRDNNVDWVKLVSWRVNGDGIGNADNVSNSFLRTQDDATYVRGNRTNCTFWTDVNGAVFVLASIPSKKIIIKDCEVIYARSSSKSWYGGKVFSCRAMGGDNVTSNVDATFENIHISDPLQTMETFQLLSSTTKTVNGLPVTETKGGYSGVKFINITSERKLYKDSNLGRPLQAGEKNLLSGEGPEGNPISSWGVTFKNVRLGREGNPNGGTLITKKSDFSDNMSPNVNANFLVTLNTTASSGGTVISNDCFNMGNVATMTATPNAGFTFTGWSGDLMGTTNPASITMNSDKTVTANFAPSNTPLPLAFINFSGYTNETNSYLNWETTNEKNASYFEIERSIEGVSFVEIGKIKCLGNEAKVNKYTFTDYNIGNQNQYYRLKQVDEDGKFNYSNIIVVKPNSISSKKAMIFPNPANLEINIDCKKGFQIFNLMGHSVLESKQPTSRIDISELPDGVYFLMIEKHLRKFIKKN